MSKGLIIPTPEVTNLTDEGIYDRIYPADYKLPRQLIHMQRKIKKKTILIFLKKRIFFLLKNLIFF